MNKDCVLFGTMLREQPDGFHVRGFFESNSDYIRDIFDVEEYITDKPIWHEENGFDSDSVEVIQALSPDELIVKATRRQYVITDSIGEYKPVEGFYVILRHDLPKMKLKGADR